LITIVINERKPKKVSLIKEVMSQSSSRKVLFSSAKMAVATLTSRVLGLVREQVMAATFGASGITDAFTVAYRLP
jgi:putative peptidoglycan lipid II flippase